MMLLMLPLISMLIIFFSLLSDLLPLFLSPLDFLLLRFHFYLFIIAAHFLLLLFIIYYLYFLFIL